MKKIHESYNDTHLVVIEFSQEDIDALNNNQELQLPDGEDFPQVIITKSPPKKEMKIKSDYKMQNAIEYLERWFDEWIAEGDWWGGSNTWDLNIFRDHQCKSSINWGKDGFNSRWVINVYGLIKRDDDELLHIDTSNEIDLFEFNLGE